MNGLDLEISKLWEPLGAFGSLVGAFWEPFWEPIGPNLGGWQDGSFDFLHFLGLKVTKR